MDKLPEIYSRQEYLHQKKPWSQTLLKDIEITLSNGNRILIPKGFTSDGATVPKIFWWVAIPVGRHLLAVILHDWLYDTKYKVYGEEEKDRKFADDEMLYWMIASNVKKSKRLAMYIAVRLKGKPYWDSNSFPVLKQV